MKIGQHIYQLRTTQNLTQEELASKVYVTRQTVSNWERGYSYPDLQSLMTISEYFNISVHELLKEDLPTIERSLSMKVHQHFQKLSTEFTLLLIWFVISSIFSIYFFRENGLLLNLIISIPWLVYKAFQVERYKNDYQLRT
ncbi:helix-turn-helix domain-containing protein [Streptococcus pluranimalium]